MRDEQSLITEVSSMVYVIIMKGFQEKTLRAKALFIQYSEVTFLYNSKVEIACTTECIIYVEFMKVNDIEFWVQLLGFCVERVESGLTPLCSFVRTISAIPDRRPDLMRKSQESGQDKGTRGRKSMCC